MNGIYVRLWVCEQCQDRDGNYWCEREETSKAVVDRVQERKCTRCSGALTLISTWGSK